MAEVTNLYNKNGILIYPATSSDAVTVGNTETLTEVLNKKVDSSNLADYATKSYVDNKVASGGGGSSSTTTVSLPYVVPSETGDDLQAAVNLAVSRGVNRLVLAGKTYNLTTTLLIPSGFQLEGVENVTRLKMTGVNKPIISSTGTPSGYTTIKNLILYGDQTQADNDGIKINDYFSIIKNLEIKKCGGKGINWHTTGVPSTLVENRIDNVIVRDCIGTSFYLGDKNNNKITDGFLINCISVGTRTNQAVMIGSAAGWKIDGLHTYGHQQCDKCIEIDNAFNTTVQNVYIEDFAGRGLSFGQVQKNLMIGNIYGNIHTPDNSSTVQKALYFSKSSVFSYRPNIAVTNVGFDCSNSGSTNIFDSDGSSMSVKASNITVCGNNMSSATIYSSNISSKIES